MRNRIRILFLGDVIGKPGRKAVQTFLPKVEADFKIVNGENLAGGIGITPVMAEEMFAAGVDVITTGNHVWKKREMVPYLMGERRVVRPLNYPGEAPGFGWVLTKKNGMEICVANVEGRVFMNALDCPFRALDRLLDQVDRRVPVIVDFHAEATAEKIALGYYLDGRVSALLGTHTHVQTADETILPGGTGYITDVGMTGPSDSVIGMDKVAVLAKFVTQIPHKFEVAKNDNEVQGVLLTIDGESRACLSIQRIKERVE